jgi:DNA primase
MRFSSPFLDEIRARVPLSSLVGRHVQWDRRKSAPGRGDYWACCPFHTEKSPSFHADDRKGRYHCFGCKASGDHFTFLVEKEGLSFPEAVERLAAEAGLPVPASTPDDEAREERRTSLYDVMELAAKHFEAELHAATGAPARAYLEGRGLKGAVLEDFRIGFAPDQRHRLKIRLAEAGITSEMMAEAGLVITGDDIAVAFDRFRGRIMFPIRDHRGRVIAFGGRALSGDQQAKYLNSPETPLFHKGGVLYNLDRARRPAHEAGQIVAVEGYMDVIAMTRAGFANTVAPLGTALTEDQLRLLWRIAPEPVLCFDGDAAGLKAAGRALDLALPLLEPGLSIRFALLPEGQDPDDLFAAQGALGLKRILSNLRSLGDMLWNRLSSDLDIRNPDSRALVEKRIENLYSIIKNSTIAKHYVSVLRNYFWTALRINSKIDNQNFKKLAGARFEKFRPLKGATKIAERELISFLILDPQLMEDHFEIVRKIEFDDKILGSMLQSLIDLYQQDPDTFHNYDEWGFLEYLRNCGFHSAEQTHGAQKAVLRGHFAEGDEATTLRARAFADTIYEISNFVALTNEIRHAMADFEHDYIESFERRLAGAASFASVAQNNDFLFFAETSEFKRWKLQAAKLRSVAEEKKRNTV